MSGSIHSSPAPLSITHTVTLSAERNNLILPSCSSNGRFVAGVSPTADQSNKPNLADRVHLSAANEFPQDTYNIHPTTTTTTPTTPITIQPQSEGLLQRWWRRARRGGTQSATNSATNSPILGHASSGRMDPSFASRMPAVQNSLSSGLRLVDTHIAKGPEGFGLSLAEVITFIPGRLLGLTPSSPGAQADQYGFYQRLLQIRRVRENDTPSTSPSPLHPSSPRLSCHSNTTATVRSGDILLAVGPHRLAGCCPDYAVRLLANVPVGATIEVTLLRGLSLAPVSTAPTPMSPSISSSRAGSSEITRSDVTVQTLVETSMLGDVHFTDPSVATPSPRGASLEQKPNSTNDGGNICSLSLMKQPAGFGFALERTEQGYVITQVSVGLVYVVTSETISTLLEPRDRILTIDNINLSQLHPAEVDRLLNACPVGKSVQLLVQKAYKNTVTQELGNLPTSQPSSSASGVNVFTAVQSIGSGALTIPQSTTQMPFPTCYRNGSLSPTERDRKHYASTIPATTCVPNSVPGNLPYAVTVQGIGVSGPCRTPDYVPVSHFLARNSLSPVGFGDTKLSTNGQSTNCTDLSSSRLAMQNRREVEVILPKNLFQGHQIRIGKKTANMNTLEVLSATGSSTDPDYIHHPRIGDVVVGIEGQSVKNMSTDDVTRLLRHHLENIPSHTIRLLVRRSVINDDPLLYAAAQPQVIRFRSFQPTRTTEQREEKNPNSVATTAPSDLDHTPDVFNVTLQRNTNEGFGFIIVSSLGCDKASEIGRIIPGSPAERSSVLRVGQRIIAINGEPLDGLHHTEVVQLIRRSQQCLQLTIQQPTHDSRPTSFSETTEMPEMGRLELSQSWTEENSMKENSNNVPALPIPARTGSQPPESREPSLYSITLQRGPEGFGFSIRGGMEFGRIPLFVFRIVQGGSAHTDGRIQVGDEIVEINGSTAHTMSHQQAVQMIQQSGCKLSLVLSTQSSRLCEAAV